MYIIYYACDDTVGGCPDLVRNFLQYKCGSVSMQFKLFAFKNVCVKIMFTILENA